MTPQAIERLGGVYFPNIPHGAGRPRVEEAVEEAISQMFAHSRIIGAASKSFRWPRMTRRSSGALTLKPRLPRRCCMYFMANCPKKSGLREASTDCEGIR